MITATRAFPLGLENSPTIHRINPIKSKINPNQEKNTVISKINPIILNRIPTVATVFF